MKQSGLQKNDVRARGDANPWLDWTTQVSSMTLPYWSGPK
jgi:hypothetical protein